jgi:ADP-ribosyl-[dinitrogen reductase] hydrolase
LSEGLEHLRSTGYWVEPLNSTLLSKQQTIGELRRDRYVGALLAGAIGDAAGLPYETRPSYAIPKVASISELRTLEGHRWSPIAAISDDTQMTLENAKWLLETGASLDPGALAHRYVNFSKYGRGLGRGTRQSLTSLSLDPVHWWSTGESSAGNGVAMRAAPAALLFQADLNLISRANAISAVMTHRDHHAVASGLIFSVLISEILASDSATFSPESTLVTLREVLTPLNLEAAKLRHRPDQPVSLIELIEMACASTEHSDEDIASKFHNGAYVIETIPFVIAMFFKYFREPDRCMAMVLRQGRDTDTNAAIVGNLLGALHGTAWLPGAFNNQSLERRDEIIQAGIDLCELNLSLTSH